MALLLFLLIIFLLLEKGIVLGAVSFSFYEVRMTEEEILKDTDAFYHSGEWRRLRSKVLQLDRYECQVCKANGKYSKGSIVHHIKHITDRPDLALNIYDGEERQLITVCKKCHEELHPEVMRQNWKRNEPLTEERWD